MSFSFHPDQVGSLFLQAHADGNVATPIPPTLPLFASAIMALGLFGGHKKWRQALRPGIRIPALA